MHTPSLYFNQHAVTSLRLGQPKGLPSQAAWRALVSSAIVLSSICTALLMTTSKIPQRPAAGHWILPLDNLLIARLGVGKPLLSHAGASLSASDSRSLSKRTLINSSSSASSSKSASRIGSPPASTGPLVSTGLGTFPSSGARSVKSVGV